MKKKLPIRGGWPDVLNRTNRARVPDSQISSYLLLDGGADVGECVLRGTSTTTPPLAQGRLLHRRSGARRRSSGEPQQRTHGRFDITKGAWVRRRQRDSRGAHRPASGCSSKALRLRLGSTHAALRFALLKRRTLRIRRKPPRLAPLPFIGPHRRRRVPPPWRSRCSRRAKLTCSAASQTRNR